MTKVEASTLEEAYLKASTTLQCSISKLQCEVVQYPSKGIFGLMKKNAVIVATCDNQKSGGAHSRKGKKITEEEYVASEILSSVKNEKQKTKSINSESKSFRPLLEKKNVVLDSFFQDDKEDGNEEVSVSYDELALLIENELKDLFEKSCFEIDVVEVDVIDSVALIFIDGNDAALLIGKEGYRYNALSYMIFNWLHSKYELSVKLEIAEFLTTQQEMIRNYMKPVIEKVESEGRGKTRFLDGILVQIALEQLRERFPNKYVAVKTSREGRKFVIINEFNNSSVVNN